MQNMIYQGKVVHHRLTPKEHRFTYDVCYYFFDLDTQRELITVPFILSFNPRHYLTPSEVRSNLSLQFGPQANSAVKKIFILTQLSYFGFCFNPVSFYFCYDHEDKLLYLLSQITNTPWGEKHINCFNLSENEGEVDFQKDFHVSPFMPMEINYKWRFNQTANAINILMENRHVGQADRFFMAQMILKAKAMTLKNVLVSVLRYPVMSFKTIAGIYWQALILFLKKVPFHTHPKKRVNYEH